MARCADVAAHDSRLRAHPCVNRGRNNGGSCWRVTRCVSPSFNFLQLRALSFLSFFHSFFLSFVDEIFFLFLVSISSSLRFWKISTGGKKEGGWMEIIIIITVESNFWCVPFDRLPLDHSSRKFELIIHFTRWVNENYFEALPSMDIFLKKLNKCWCVFPLGWTN